LEEIWVFAYDCKAQQSSSQLALEVGMQLFVSGVFEAVTAASDASWIAAIF
jgi:hypothetical protein